VESRRESTARLQDLFAGIDWQAQEPGGGVVLGASRVQWTHRDFRSFTIRDGRSSGVATELQKRRRAREHGTLNPVWMVHAYVAPVGDDLRSCAVIKTEELLDWIELAIARGRQIERRPTRDKDGSVQYFSYVEWKDLTGCESFWQFIRGDQTEAASHHQASEVVSECECDRQLNLFSSHGHGPYD